MNAVLSLLGKLVSAAFGSADAAANAAKTSGLSTIDVGKTSVSVSALVTQLDALAKLDPTELTASFDFKTAKDFLLSQNFTQDIVLVADILGVVGLVVPPAAVAANDLRTLAMLVTVAQKFPLIVEMLNRYFGVKPESAPGQNPTYDRIWPSTLSPASKTNGPWPTAIQP